MTNIIKTFEAGRTYWTRSICDHDCIYRVTIIRRTAKSVWIKDMNRNEVRRTISIHGGVEQIYPHGRYSMCAIIGADRVEAEAAAA